MEFTRSSLRLQICKIKIVVCGMESWQKVDDPWSMKAADTKSCIYDIDMAHSRTG